ncbi:MAG TPA: alpha-glucan family phosphorylase [Gammaproteobacteria bacterium]
MKGTEFSIEVQAVIPEQLRELNVLANDLSYSWNRQIRSLFFRLDPQLWTNCNHNPKIFLRRVSQERLDQAANDPLFIKDYRLALSWFEDQKKCSINPEARQHLNQATDLIAYFSAEFGFHESLPIYSGGLGILAGDHCKAASDLCLPFVAVGLLYHQGYFSQKIDNHGRQIAEYKTHDFQDLPISLVTLDNGSPLIVKIKIAQRNVDLCVWRTVVGHINLYLLDSDVDSNSEEDRLITYRLYGGDKTTRIKQEIVLGIGGVRALRALGLRPNVWHINEGHSAFQILERMREYVSSHGDWTAALEQVAIDTVFTTHTPVPAGHDLFPPELIEQFLPDYLRELKMDIKTFMGLGRSNNNHDQFNMTSLALRGSRHHNGVSRIHGRVASQMEGYIWPEIPPEENPITHITNGIHVPTFLAQEWANLFDARFINWRDEISNPDFWECLSDIKDYRFWSIRQSLRSEMLKHIHGLVLNRLRRNDSNEVTIRKTTRLLSQPDADILVLGFARRFATYKRATLLFVNDTRLRALLNNPERPVLLVFAGKAHPQDEPGQKLIETIHKYSMDPDFIGKIILLENYDTALARKLVTGVDVWINNPEYPLEACGTSGQKAAVNGVLNLSVLDGWWDEGYNGKNGWAVVPHDPHYDPVAREREEANDLMDILEKQVIPTYFERHTAGYSEKWIEMCKESMKSIIPRFNARRMVMDYVAQLYGPAIKQHRKLHALDLDKVGEFARWKKKVVDTWDEVTMRLVDDIPKKITYHGTLALALEANLARLSAGEVKIELLLGERKTDYEKFTPQESFFFMPEDPQATGVCRYHLSIPMETCGLKNFKIRAYPYHELLTHPFELGRMEWL